MSLDKSKVQEDFFRFFYLIPNDILNKHADFFKEVLDVNKDSDFKISIKGSLSELKFLTDYQHERQMFPYFRETYQCFVKIFEHKQTDNEKLEVFKLFEILMQNFINRDTGSEQIEQMFKVINGTEYFLCTLYTNYNTLIKPVYNRLLFRAIRRMISDKPYGNWALLPFLRLISDAELNFKSVIKLCLKVDGGKKSFNYLFECIDSKYKPILLEYLFDSDFDNKIEILSYLNHTSPYNLVDEIISDPKKTKLIIEMFKFSIDNNIKYRLISDLFNYIPQSLRLTELIEHPDMIEFRKDKLVKIILTLFVHRQNNHIELFIKELSINEINIIIEDESIRDKHLIIHSFIDNNKIPEPEFIEFLSSIIPILDKFELTSEFLHILLLQLKKYNLIQTLLFTYNFKDRDIRGHIIQVLKAKRMVNSEILKVIDETSIRELTFLEKCQRTKSIEQVFSYVSCDDIMELLENSNRSKKFMGALDMLIESIK
jgi:hypothetical protein